MSAVRFGGPVAADMPETSADSLICAEQREPLQGEKIKQPEEPSPRPAPSHPSESRTVMSPPTQGSQVDNTKQQMTKVWFTIRWMNWGLKGTKFLFDTLTLWRFVQMTFLYVSH